MPGLEPEPNALRFEEDGEASSELSRTLLRSAFMLGGWGEREMDAADVDEYRFVLMRGKEEVMMDD